MSLYAPLRSTDLRSWPPLRFRPAVGGPAPHIMQARAAGPREPAAPAAARLRAHTRQRACAEHRAAQRRGGRGGGREGERERASESDGCASASRATNSPQQARPPQQAQVIKRSRECVRVRGNVNSFLCVCVFRCCGVRHSVGGFGGAAARFEGTALGGDWKPYR